jgi:uncharacterized membrane protein YdbT with pleckstrin-like domain
MASETPQTTGAPVPADQYADLTAKERFQAVLAERAKNVGATPVERSLWKGGYSPKAMYGTWAISTIVTIAAITGVALLSPGGQTVWMITGAAILLWWCFAIGTYIYRVLGMHYELTTQRFIHQVGVLVRQTDRIEVIDIDDVSYTQGVIQRILGVGTIRITGSDRTHPELVMYGIDKVPEVASLIDDVRREERRRRSLHTIS